jgi:hypothetical protein
MSDTVKVKFIRGKIVEGEDMPEGTIAEIPAAIAAQFLHEGSVTVDKRALQNREDKPSA